MIVLLADNSLEKKKKKKEKKVGILEYLITILFKMFFFVASESLVLEVKLQNRKYLFSNASLQPQTFISKMLQQPQHNNI